jgi:hypothetical protein
MADLIDLDAISSAVNQAVGGKASKGKASIDDLSSDFSARVAQMQAAYKQQFGTDLPITSGRRTTEQQRQLYENRGSNPYPVAAPGTSQHETGNAIDIPKSVPDSFLAQFGLHRPNKKDPVHVEMMAQKTAPNEPGSLLDTGDIDSLVKDVYANPPKQTGKIGQAAQGAAVDTLNTLFKAKRDLGAATASLADVTIGNVIPSIAGPLTYAGARALGGAKQLYGKMTGTPQEGVTPEQAAQLEKQVVGATESPFGKLLGVTQEPAYKGEASRQIMDFIGENFAKGADWIAEKFGLPVSDVQNMMGTVVAGVTPAAVKTTGKAVQAAQQAMPEVVRPTMADMKAQFQQKTAPNQVAPGGNLGSAAATNETMLQEAIGRASPQLAGELKKIDPASVNPAALDNYLKADQFGIRLTKGQATGDPYLISMEQNERGLKKQLVDEFNQQNRILTEKADEIKQKAGEGTHEVNYVGNAERTMDAFKEINAESDKAIKSAYKELEDLGAGKIEVDSKTFGDNAMKALTANEDIDFLPSTIKSKIEAYQGGKPMNFAQYENLRTQISRETRKAQRADDGNAVHALTIARSELEKLPLLNETAEAKVVADKARSLAAQEFGLLDKRRPTYNQVYADIVNGAADTKDFIPKVVLRSKNADFGKAMDMLETKPDSLNQLRAGTLDYMIREATDASGNFKTAKFNDMVDSLDVNGKLTRLFGENSQQIKDLAHVGKLINARPTGQYVNTSNTTTAATQMAKQYGLKLAQDVPVVRHLVEPVVQMRAERKLKREVEETMRPGAGAGTKLKDMTKEK